MIRVIVITALGYWISRKVYERFDLNQKAIESAETKRRLENYFKSKGMNIKEIDKAVQIILK